MEQWIKITLKEYKELLEIVGEYKLLCYAYQQPQEETHKTNSIGFNTRGDEEIEELDDQFKQLIKS